MLRNGNIINTKVIDYIDTLYHSLTEDLGELRSQAEENLVPVILKDTERYLDVLVKMSKPKRILEFGTAVGYSACCFAEMAGKDSEVVSLEASEDMYAQAVENIKRLGYDSQVKVILGDARETALALEGQFDFVFIDAGKSHYLEFWEAIRKNVHPGTVIVGDNILLRAKTASDDYDPLHKFRTNVRHMREFLEYITTTDEAVSSVSPAGDGISVSYIVK